MLSRPFNALARFTSCSHPDPTRSIGTGPQTEIAKRPGVIVDASRLCLLCGLSAAILALAGAGAPATEALAYTRTGLQEAEFWRLLSAHLVHLSPMHAFMNVLGLVLVAGLLWDVLAPRALAAAMVASGLAVSLGLWAFDPEVDWYVGFSGVLHGLFVWGGLRCWQQRSGLGGLLLLAVLAKLVWEQSAGPMPGADRAIGGAILVQSHLYGAVGGGLAWGLGWGLGWAQARNCTPPKGCAGAVLGLALAATLAGPGPAHRLEGGPMARVALTSGGDIALYLSLDVPAFVLRTPSGHLSETEAAQLQIMSDRTLQDYIDGAGAYLMSGVRLRPAQGAPDSALAPGRIRMPTPAALRRHAKPAAAPGQASDVLVLIFPRAAVAAVADLGSGDMLRLELPALLGPVTAVFEEVGGRQVVDFMPPGVLSEPFRLARKAPLWTRVGEGLLAGMGHVALAGWDAALFAALIALSVPLLRRGLARIAVVLLAQALAFGGVWLWGEVGLWTLLGPPVAVASAATLIWFGGQTLLHLRARAPDLPASQVDAACPVPLRLTGLGGAGLIHGLALASVVVAGPGPVAGPETLGHAFGSGVAITAVVLATGGLVQALARRNPERGIALRMGLSGGIALCGLFWCTQRLGGLAGVI